MLLKKAEVLVISDVDFEIFGSSRFTAVNIRNDEKLISGLTPQFTT